MREVFPETLRIILEPIVAYLDDPAVTTIFVNGPDEIWIEKDGALQRGEAKGRFTEGILLDAVRAAARAAGGGLSGEATRLDARLAGGARITALLPPVARKGPCLVLRKADEAKLGIDDLVAQGALSAPARRFLEAAVQSRRNVVVYGAPGSGRTTLLGALASFTPESDRVVVVEAHKELALKGQHVVPLALVGERGGELIDAVPTLRADLVVVGELDGAETLAVVRLMSGGTPVLTAVTGNSPSDALMRVEGLCHLAGKDLSPRAVRGLVAAGVDLLVGTARFADGARRVVCVTECRPLGPDGEFRLLDVFRTPRPAASGDPGPLEPCGVVPAMAVELRAAGFLDLRPSFFGASTEGAGTGSGAFAAVVPAPAAADAPPAPPPSLSATRASAPPGDGSGARRRMPSPRPVAAGDEGAAHAAPHVAGAATPAPAAALRANDPLLNTMRSDPPAGAIDDEPGVVIGGAAAAGRYARPDSPYVIEGMTGFSDEPKRHQERTLPGPGGAGGADGAPPVVLHVPPPGAVAAGLAAGADAATPPPDGERDHLAPADAAGAEAAPSRRGGPRTTLAVDVPVIRRRDGDDSSAKPMPERRPTGGPRVVPAEGAAARAHLGSTKEYPALRLSPAAGGENGETAPDKAPAGAQRADDLVEDELSDPFAGWDDEARRELEEDRRRRTLIAEDVNLDDPPEHEERAEDTNPRAEAPDGFGGEE